MLGQQLGIWSRDGDAGRAQGVVPEPARGGLVAIEVDDVDALSGPGVGARERDTTGGLTHPAFAAGKCEDHEKLCQPRKPRNPEVWECRKFTDRLRCVQKDSSESRMES